MKKIGLLLLILVTSIYNITGQSNTYSVDTNIFAPRANPKFSGTATGLTKAMVGLSLVNNTADTTKPVSNPQKAAINTKLHNASSKTDLIACATNGLTTAHWDGSDWVLNSGNVTSNGGSYPGTLVRVSSTAYWERKYSKLDARFFGVKNDGSDNSVAMTNAMVYAASNITNDSKGELIITKGTYKLNIDINYNKVNIIGEAENAVILKPYDNSKPIITINFDASWDKTTIKNIRFEGTDLTSVGIQFGHIPYQTNDEYAGRTNIENCKFINFDKCISRTSGNIGIYINNCTFSTANYHLWGQGVSNMQVGVTHVQDSHFDSANLASCFIKSGFSGDGQFIFNTCVWEGNAGFILFVDTYSEKEFVPELAFENCWNENNATSSSVVINSISYTPKFAYLKNVTNMSFINSPVSTIQLINSNVYLDRCDITYLSVTKDSQSYIKIDNAIAESLQTHEFVNSFKNTGRVAGGYSSYFASYHRKNTSKSYTSNTKLSIPFTSTVGISGSTTRNTTSITGDGTTFANCESLLINNGDVLLPPGSATIQANKYYVYSISYKLFSGNAPNIQITYYTTLSPLISLNSNKWETLVGCVSTFGLTGLPQTVAFYITPATSGSSTVYFGGFQLLEFDNQQEAMNFLESKTFAN